MTSPATQHGEDAAGRNREGRGWGLVLFAGVVLAWLGFLNLMDGVAASSGSNAVMAKAQFVFGSLHWWGWVTIIAGVLQLLAGAWLLLGVQFARWFGVAVIGLNAIGQVFFIPAYPWWSLAIIAVDLIALYALCVYGGSVGSVLDDIGWGAEAPVGPAHTATQRREERPMTAKAHTSQRGGPGPAERASSGALVLASLMQLVTVAMTPRLRQRRSLRAIEQNLAASDPSLTGLFFTFARLSHGEERGPAEKINDRPLRVLTRRLATALEFDPADPWRRPK